MHAVKKQKKILFLEDEEELLKTITALLRDQGYSVVGRVSAEEGFEAIERDVPDLLLVDIKLPGIDGFEFFKEVRKNEKMRTTPFVFLTAFNNLKAAMEARKQGATEYITKPFDFEYLITRIRDLVPPR